MMKVKTCVCVKFMVLAWLLCLLSKACMNSDEKFNRTVSGRRRSKRIAGGLPLESHESYNTQYFIQLQQTWSCTTEQSDHILADCWHVHKCGGSLVHPSFVLTACHCLSYSVFYQFEYEKPFPYVPDLDPADVPSYLYSFDWLPEVMKEIIVPLHPLHNAMTLWAGSPHMKKMTQKRHAAAFFPHHYCIHYQQEKYPAKWNKTGYRHFEFDVGLVKTCIPFEINKGVRLAPIKQAHLLKPQLADLVKTSKVCLYAGWGVVPYEGEVLKSGSKTKTPEVLHHSWRYIECSKSCHTRFSCVLCSHYHGSKYSHHTVGDSGSPITCERFYVGVISQGSKDWTLNATVMRDFPIACLDGLLESTYLDRLKKLNDNIFHWIDGKPVPLNPPKT